MSKKNTTPAKAENAKKINFGVLIPVILLIVGLLIMTFCFFNVNNQLTEARAALAALAQQTDGNVTPDEDPAPFVNEEVDVLAPVEEELAAVKATLADTEAKLAAKEAELAAANEIIADQEAKLTIANEAIAQATEALSAITGLKPVEPAVEEPVVEEPVVEEPEVEETEAVEEPVVEEPVAEETEAVEEPVVEETEAVEEPVVEENEAAEAE